MKIGTYSGRLIDVNDPRSDDFLIEDISHALGHVNRFSGHTSVPVPVALHSVAVSYLCNPKHALIGLLHDASEAYMGDVPRPIKLELPKYKTIEDNLLSVILKKFCGVYGIPEDVHLADRAALRIEWALFRNSECPLGPSTSEEKEFYMDIFENASFLSRYYSLVNNSSRMPRTLFEIRNTLK